MEIEKNINDSKNILKIIFSFLLFQNTKNNENTSHQRHRKENHRHYSHPQFIKVLIVLLVLSSFPLTLANSICKHHEYWDSNLDECVPCTKCNRHQIVIRPCQRHLDTVCRPINSVDIDWSKSMLMATDRTTLKKVSNLFYGIKLPLL